MRKTKKTKNHLLSKHPKISHGKIGVMLINLGTPDNYDFLSVRKYLKEFLSDRRVIELPRLLWWILLNIIILNLRPQRISKIYQEVWIRKTNESPLRYHARIQAKKIAERFASSDKNNLIKIDWAMRYGNPSIKSVAEKLQKQGCDTLIGFALYPQYSATTTATAYDELFRAAMKMRNQPAITTIASYHDNPEFISILVDSIKSHVRKLSWKPQAILVSFHGLPKQYFTKGDPYYCHCHKTARLLREKLKMKESNFYISFQSRIGKAEWLKPYTDDVVAELAKNRLKNLLVITPGFSVDCIETLEEIGIRSKNIFLKNGGKNFSLVPCLNSSPESINLLFNIIKRKL